MSEIARRRAAAAASADTNPAYREKQDLIRKAAGRVFHQRGFHAATLNDVAAEAGVDRASLYYYVGSKEQLFRDVVSEAVTANVEAAEAIAAEAGSAADKLTRVIRGLMTSFEQNYPYMYVFVQEDFAKLGEGAGQDNEWVATVQGWNSRYFGIVRRDHQSRDRLRRVQFPAPRRDPDPLRDRDDELLQRVVPAAGTA